MTHVYSTLESERLTAKIMEDEYPFFDYEDYEIKIAYLDTSRYVLGTEPVSEEKMNKISKWIEMGHLIGVPVYAYVHGGVTIRAGQGFSCPWDSGQSGFVYCSAEWAKKEYLDKAKQRHWRKAALSDCLAYADCFNKYLTRDVWGIVIERKADREEIDSVWGIYGLSFAEQEAKDMLNYYEMAQ